MKVNFSKRFLSLLLAGVITFSSVSISYYQSTQAADIVTGIVATVGGAPLLTALTIGGVVVAGGVALYELYQTDLNDWRNFASGIKQGFEEFVADRETTILKEQDSNLSDQEAATQGVAIARQKVNDFWDSTVSGVTNTTKNITFNAYKYWDLYSRIIGNVADYGLSDEIITDTTPISPKVSSIGGNYNFTALENIGQNSIVLGENRFINKGVWKYWNNVEWVRNPVDYSNVTSDRVRIPFVYLYPVNNKQWRYELHSIDVNKLTGVILAHSLQNYGGYVNMNSGVTYAQDFQWYLNDTNISCVVDLDHGFSPQLDINDNNYVSLLAIGGAAVASKIWERTIKNTLDNTKAGKSISTGRKQLVNEGDYIYSAYKENSVPIKKSTIRVSDNAVTGEIGWDIPSAGTYDDVFSGNKPYGQVVGQTGSIAVPDDVIIGANDPSLPIDNDTTITFPDTADVQDSTDYPKDAVDDPSIPDNPPKPEEIPDKPFQDVIDEQGGTFYPQELDLTTLFPFCIPFDIIYLVQKFDANGEEAPVITIPIVYPNVIRSAMGSDSYEVVIDFQDFLVVRNVLRIFLLLLFIAGLMKITRDLIRG